MPETTQKYTLEFPVKTPKDVLTEVTIRRPLVKDLIKYNLRPEMDMSENVAYVASLCNVPEEDIANFDATDFSNIVEIITRFQGTFKEGSKKALSSSHALL